MCCIHFSTREKNQCLCDVEKIYMSKYTVNSIGVDKCACGGLLLDKRLCVRCELRKKGKHRVLGP